MFKVTPIKINNNTTNLANPIQNQLKDKVEPLFASNRVFILENNLLTTGKMNSLYFNNFMTKNNTSFKGSLSVEDRIRKYPQDHEYRKVLAKNVKCEPKDLMSVIGFDELKDYLKTAKPEDFCPGENFANVKNGTIRLNLHMHTTESDGVIKVEDLLDQSVEYADKMKNPPLIFAITNHDILDDSKKAIKIIASDPEKYKNIRLVSGVEITTRYPNEKLVKIPIQLEVLNYCINPFDRDINDFLTNIRNDNIQYAREIIDEAIKSGLKTSLEDFQQIHNLAKIGASPAFIPALFDFLLDQAKVQNVDDAAIMKLIDKHIEKLWY